MDKAAFVIRDAIASDLNFIQATFLKSMKRESSLGRSCSTRVFFSEFPLIVDHLLNTSKTIVACSKEDHEFILGYLIYEPHAIHYAFVRASLRKLNVAKDLIGHAFPDAKALEFTMNTNSAKQIRAKYPELILNPFHLYKKGA